MNISIHEALEEFKGNLNFFLKSIPYMKKLYSVEFLIFEEPMNSFEKDQYFLLNKTQGPFVFFLFYKEEYLLLRSESYFAILNIQQSIKRNIQLFTDIEYVTYDKNFINQMTALFPAVKNIEKIDGRDFFDSIKAIYKGKNHFINFTYIPLFFYIIIRYDYPRNSFQDSSFLDFNYPKLKKKDFTNFRTKSELDLIEFNEADFIQIGRIKLYENIYNKILHLPTFNIFVEREIDENNIYDKNERTFRKHNDYWLFVKCYGYYKTHKTEKMKLIYQYMPIKDFCKYCSDVNVNNTFRLINLLRLIYAIDYLHAHGYIYRNLKDAKVLIDHDGLLHLNNFGYVLKIDRKNSHIDDIGSEKMMAPEQRKGNHVQESDIYAFGKIIICLFNGYHEKDQNGLINEYGKLNEIVKICLDDDYQKRLSSKQLIQRIDEIINTFPLDDAEKTKVRNYHEILKEKSFKYVVWKYLLKNSLHFCVSELSNETETDLKYDIKHIDFLRKVYDVNLYYVESLEKDKLILDDFFNKKLSPFIIVAIEKIDESEYLVIAFESSCLIAKLSILQENENFYQKKLLNLLHSNISIYSISKEKLNSFCQKFDTDGLKIVHDDIFYHSIKCMHLMIALTMKEEKLITDKFASKSFSLLIGYLIKRFYYSKDQFIDPYFFNYDKICNYIKDKMFNWRDFFILRFFHPNRCIAFFKKTLQLFMIIYTQNDEKDNLLLKKNIIHPSISEYFGYASTKINQNERYHHIYGIVNDFSLHQLLEDKSAILEDPTIRSKIIINILSAFDYLNEDELKIKKVSSTSINTKYIFFDSNLNVKIAFPEYFDYDTIDNNVKNLALILLSLYHWSSCGDLSFDMALDDIDKIYQENIEKYSIPKDLYPLNMIYYKCINIERENMQNKRTIIRNLIDLIYNDDDLFGEVNYFAIRKEFEKLNLKFSITNHNTSIKFKAKNFFRDSLCKTINDYTIYFLLKDKEFFYEEILAGKPPPFIPFYLNKLDGKFHFIFVISKMVAIYDMNDLDHFIESFFTNFKDKILIPINDLSLANFQIAFSKYKNQFKCLQDSHLIEKDITKITSQIYRQTNSNELEFICLKLIIIYLIKRFDFKSSDFDDNSFRDFPHKSFTVFNKDDFYLLYSIGYGGTSQIYFSVHKQTFHVFAIKSFTKNFDNIFQREQNLYSKTFNTLSPFATRCYGYVQNSRMLVFEYMANGRLNDIRENKLVDPTLNTTIMLRVLSSIEYLHSNNMIYKDLKPDNILFNHDFEPFLSDFGAISMDNNFTWNFGNPLFAAPEFMNNEKYTSQIDVYSFGLLLYYLCTDNENFLHETQFDKKPQLDIKFNLFQDIYSKCISYDPKGRYTSINLLFVIIYNELFFPGTNKDEIHQLITEIIVNLNFKDRLLYQLFFYARGISFEKDLKMAKKLIKEHENELFENDLLCFELGNLFLFDFKKPSEALTYYEKALEKGNSKAENMIGIGYFKGIFGERNCEKALNIFNEIKNIDSYAMNNYAYLLMFGSSADSKDGEKKSKMAVSLFHKAIKMSNCKASYVNLGDVYSGLFQTCNFFQAKDLQKSINFYLKACDFDIDLPYIRLANLCIKENGLINQKGALYYYQKALEKSKKLDTYREICHYYFDGKLEYNEDLIIESLLAMKEYFQIGKIYYKRKDFENAKEYFYKASKMRNSHAQNYLGIIYFYEEIKDGLLSEKSQSLKYFKKAAKDRGNFVAQYNLGLLYCRYSKFNVMSFYNSILLFENIAENNIKANIKLGEIHENISNNEKAIYYYERALKLSHNKYVSLLNKIGVFYATGNGVSINYRKAVKNFKIAHKKRYIPASNNLGVLLMNYFVSNNHIKKAYGIFYYLHRDYKYILSSCNLGFHYIQIGQIHESIPYFEKALLNFKEQYLENKPQTDDNIPNLNGEEKECLCIIILYTYMLILNYYLDMYNVFLNSKNLVENHFKDLLIFYHRFKMGIFIKKLYTQYNMHKIQQLNSYLHDFNDKSSYYISLNLLHELIKNLIPILRSEIYKNNSEILFCYRRKINENIEENQNANQFISGLLEIPNNHTIMTVVDYIKVFFSITHLESNIQLSSFFRFRELYPNELCLNEIFSQINFLFVQKLDTNLKKMIKQISKGARYVFCGNKFDKRKWVLSLLINNYCICFFPTYLSQMDQNEGEIFSILQDPIKVDLTQAKKYIDKNEYQQYFNYMRQLIIEEDELKLSLIKDISYYSLLRQHFYLDDYHDLNSFETTKSKSGLFKFNRFDFFTLNEINENKFKVINLKTNSVFLLKENENKETKKEEIEFYSFFKVLQEKKIVPPIVGKIENEDSLLFEYYDNLTTFYKKEWEEINDTIKTIILIKIILIINYLHAFDIILCGIQLESFLIRKVNENYDVRIDDLYHFHQQDYVVSTSSEYVAPEIKSFSQIKNKKEKLPISYHSDVFSFGKIAQKLGFDENNPIIEKCISENPKDRPNSLFILISMFCNEYYFSHANCKIINQFMKSRIKSLITDCYPRLDLSDIKNSNNFLENLDRLNTNEDYDVFISLLHAKLLGHNEELKNAKLEFLFTSNVKYIQYQNILDSLNLEIPKKLTNTLEEKSSGYHEDRVEEIRNHFFVGIHKADNITYELFEDQKRTKIIPNDQSPVRYTGWTCTKKYEEAIRKDIFEKRHDVDIGYEYSADGNIRYKVTVDQERKIVRDLRTGKDISRSPWYNTPDLHKIEAGRKTEKSEFRFKRIEKKQVQHHYGHGLFGGSVHTHYRIFRIFYQEERIVKTDFDGNVTFSEWLLVPGSTQQIEITNGEENGWTAPYEREIQD